MDGPAKSLQSCPTLCDSIDGSPLGSTVPGILQARTLEWVAISFSNAWKWKVKVKSLRRVQLPATPWIVAHQAPPSMGVSTQDYWSGVPGPSPWMDLEITILSKESQFWRKWGTVLTISKAEKRYTTFSILFLQLFWKCELCQNKRIKMHSTPSKYQRRQWQATPVLLPRKSHGWRRLVGCIPWGRYE